MLATLGSKNVNVTGLLATPVCGLEPGVVTTGVLVPEQSAAVFVKSSTSYGPVPPDQLTVAVIGVPS